MTCRTLADLVLLRIEPSAQRGEIVSLDASRPTLSVGRAESNAIRLYTATASRVHAQLRVCPAEGWRIEPVTGCTISIDGDPTEEAVVLEPGMNLLLGGDHLRCENASDLSLRRSRRGVAPQTGASKEKSWNLREAAGHFLRRVRGR